MQKRKQASQIRQRLTYANVMVTIFAFIVLSGATAYASGQLGKNSVGSRQLKAKAVTTGKVAPDAINGSKIADRSVTGADINLSALGTVPAATSATGADNSQTVGGHSASCPTGTTLVRGICFDSSSNPEAPNLEAAADDCAAKGGFLPSPMELYSARDVLNLGSGIGNNHQYTDDVFANTETQSNYSTVVIDGTGAVSDQLTSAPSRYICAYPLVR